MRNPLRINRILNKLRQVWIAHPDMRLGQLILNIPAISGLNLKVDTFNCEDELWESLLDQINGDC